MKFLADTQRLLLESFQTQQQHHMSNNGYVNPHYQQKRPIDDYSTPNTFNSDNFYEDEDQLGSKNYDQPPIINNYYPGPSIPNTPPPLPNLPYGNEP